MSASGLTPEERAELEEHAAALGVALGRDSAERLGRYLDLIATWNASIRLTGERARETLVRKHVADSLAVVAALPGEGLVVDVGSGAGFPGVVIACVRPDLDVVLVESRRKKASFLRDVARTVGLDRVRVLNARAQEAATDLRASAAVVVSRAVRSEDFLPVAARLVAPDGCVIAMQTPRSVAEVRAVAERIGLRPEAVREYVLPDGGTRCLLVLRR